MKRLINHFVVLTAVLLVLFELSFQKLAYAKVYLGSNPMATYYCTLRKKIYYKVVDNAPKAVDQRVYHIAGDNGENGLIGNYSSFGVSGIVFGIDFDYWVEESFYIFHIISDPYPITCGDHYIEVDYGRYFGETDTVDVDLVQLPWNIFEFLDLGNDLPTVIDIISNADANADIGDKTRAKIISTLKFGTTEKATNSAQEKLRAISPIANLKAVEQNMGSYYSYGLYALKVKHSLDFSNCGGVAGYSLTEYPQTFEVSLTDVNGNPISNFDVNNGIVINVCINGYTTPGYGFVVQGIRFPEQGKQEEQQEEQEEINYIYILDNAYQKFGKVNESLSFDGCLEKVTFTTTYIQERIAELGGTAASFWTAERHKNVTYYFDFGDGNRSVFNNCGAISHAYSQAGKYALKVDVEYDLYAYDIRGRLIFVRHVTKTELTRKLLIIEPVTVLTKAQLSVINKPGDMNLDECVDRIDLSILLAQIRQGQSMNLLRYDVNGDGVINIADARKLVTLFTNSTGAGCPSP